MQVLNVLHVTRWKCRPQKVGWLDIQHAKMMHKIATSAPWHKFVGLYLRK